MRNSLKSFWDRFNVYILIAFLSVVPFWRTGTKGLIEVTDADFPLQPIINLKSQLFVWYDKVTMGYDVSSAFLSQLPFYGFIAVLQKLGMPLPIIERFWFILGLFLAGSFAYALNKHLTKNKWSALLGAVFYVYNPVTMHLLSQGEHVAIVCYAFAPLFLLLSIRAFETKKLKFPLYIALLSIFAAITSLPSLAIDFLPTLLYAAYALFTRKDKRFAWKFLGILIGSLFLVNAWWLVPGVWSLRGNAQMADLNRMWLFNWKIISDISDYLNTLLATSLAKIFVESYLASALLVCGTLSISLYLYIKKERPRFVQFFMLLTLFSFLFAMGDKGIWGDAQQLVMTKVSQLQMFRNPYKFAQLTVLSFSALAALSLDFLFDQLHKRMAKILLILTFSTLVIINSLPMFTGSLSGFLRPVEIPRDYYTLQSYLEGQTKHGGVLILPQEEWLSKYTWSPYDMPDFSRYLLSNQIIRDYPENRLASLKSVYLMTTTYDVINNSLPSALKNYLYLMNADYILLHKDVEKYTRQIVPYKKLEKSLSAQAGIQPIYSTKEFSLYQNELTPGIIYASDYIIFNPNNINPNLVENVSKLDGMFKGVDLSMNPIFSIGSEQNDNLKTIGTSNTKPIIKFNKISPVEYEVHVSGATSPFALAFLESFNKNWEVSVNGIRLDEDKHFVANGYANGWVINQKGEYTIKLYYGPQRIFLGFAISGICIVVAICIYLLILNYNEKIKRN